MSVSMSCFSPQSLGFRFQLLLWRTKRYVSIEASFGEVEKRQKVQTVWSRYLKIILAPSNFVSVFYPLRRSFRHLSQVFSSIRWEMVEKTYFFQVRERPKIYVYWKNQVSSITSERIDPNSWLRCLQKRNHPRNTLTKFEESRTILRGPPETSPKLASMRLQVMAKLDFGLLQVLAKFCHFG